MSKLHFLYSTMNAGKTTHLLSTAHDYRQNGNHVMLLTSTADSRNGIGRISSRIGINAPAIAIGSGDDIHGIVSVEHEVRPVTAVLVDEVQFMTPEHVLQMVRIVDELGIVVMAYGLKNNVFGELFSPAIGTLMAMADQFREIKKLCHCGRKATMILRYDRTGAPVRSGKVVEIGGEGRYVSVCRSHWTIGEIGPASRRLLTEGGS